MSKANPRVRSLYGVVQVNKSELVLKRVEHITLISEVASMVYLTYILNSFRS